MFQLKNKPDTKFRACKLGCKRTVWTEVPVVCADCRSRLAEIAAGQKRAKRRTVRGPLPAAVSRGRQMSRDLGRVR